MATLTKTGLEGVLARRLKLKAPRFALRKFGGRLVGSVISDSFRGRTDLQRQRMIQRALEAELGPQANRRVGMLLAYTDAEWDVDLEYFHRPKRRPARARVA